MFTLNGIVRRRPNKMRMTPKPLPTWIRTCELNFNTQPKVESSPSAAAGIALTLPGNEAVDDRSHASDNVPAPAGDWCSCSHASAGLVFSAKGNRKNNSSIFDSFLRQN